MKQFFSLFLFILIALQATAVVPEKPNPPKLVNDYAGLLSNAEVEMLEQKLVYYDDTTSTQITIVTLLSLNGEDIGSYAQDMFELWGIGQAGKDNGILLLVSIGDRKMRIHTGYGVESKITDGFSSDVINHIMVPRFKKEEYYLGLDEATTAIIQQMAGEYKVHNDFKIPGAIKTILGISALLAFIWIFKRKGGSGSLRRIRTKNYSTGRGRSFRGFGGGRSGGGGASGSW